MDNTRPENSDVTEATEGQAPEKQVEAGEAEEERTPVELTAEHAVDPPEVEPEVADESPAPVPLPPAPTPAPRRGGVLSLIFGGGVAALLGAGAAIYALPQVPQEWARYVLPTQAEDSGLQATIAQQQSQIAQLTQDLAAVKTAPGPAPDLSGVQSALDEAVTSVQGMQASLDALTARVGALEQGGGVPADGAGLQAQIDALKAAVQQAGSAQSVTQEQIAAAAAEAKARIDEAEAQAAKLRAESEATAKRAMAQAAAARVAAAFDSGAPLAPALADAEAAGLAVPDLLKGEIPTLAAVQTEFAEAARQALVLSRKETAGGSMGEKIGAFLLAQTGARSLEPKEGNDPDAVLSRAQAAVDAGNLDVALSEITALPASGQAALQSWAALAGQRATAAKAVAEMAQSVK